MTKTNPPSSRINKLIMATCNCSVLGDEAKSHIINYIDFMFCGCSPGRRLTKPHVSAALVILAVSNFRQTVSCEEYASSFFKFLFISLFLGEKLLWFQAQLDSGKATYTRKEACEIVERSATVCYFGLASLVILGKRQYNVIMLNLKILICVTC